MDTMRAIILGLLTAYSGSLLAAQTPASDGNQHNPLLPRPSGLLQTLPHRERIEILTDTLGPNLNFYAQRQIAAPIHRNWFQLMPAEAQPPSSRQGQAAVEFSVSRDGAASDIKLVQSSGDDALDKAALYAVRQSSPFAEFPHEYKGKSISLRARFSYNPALEEKIQGLKPAHGLLPGYIREPHPAGSQQPMPRAIYTTEPEYSEQARHKKVEGVVVLRVTISPSGDVTDAVVVTKLGSGLDEKALEAVRKWKFTPASKDGRPVSAEISVEISFHLFK